MCKVAMVLVLILGTSPVAISQQARQIPTSSAAQQPLTQAIEDASSGLAQLQKIHANTAELNEKMSALVLSLSKKTAEVGRLAAAKGTSSAALLEAIKEMSDMQMSFNLQYLQLQEQMQSDNRQFTAVSNVLKTKHDTVKNSISNIR
jgi:hypothetical protein